MGSKIKFFLLGTLMCGTLSAAEDGKKTKGSWWGKRTKEAKPAEFQRGDDPLPLSAPQGYNTPAQVHLNHKMQMFASASFLYWEAQEDGLDLATTAVFVEDLNQVIRTGIDGSSIFQNFEYESGFKAALGFNFEHCDNWTLALEYTRFHQATTKEAIATSLYDEVEAIYLADWYFQTSNHSQSPACNYLHSRWSLGIDWLDLFISRPFYQGRKMTVTPFGGIRGGFLSQSLDMYMTGVLNLTPFNEQSFSNNKIDSWAVGPRMGFEGRFLLGMGFRFQGMIGASLLFTKYDTISHYEDALSDSGETVMYSMDGYTAMRPALEANLGLGWGIYFCKQKMHIDFSATYDFNYLWSQNMMRSLADLNVLGVSGSPGDLSLQGLSVSGSFHF